MATLKKTPNAQTVLAAEFTFDISAADQMVNTSGVVTAFKAASGTVYDIITPPLNSLVVGGDVQVLTASDETGTATASLGDSSSATRYANAVNIKSTARTALTLPNFLNSNGLSYRLTLANQNGNATVGKVKFTVLFTVQDRATENLKTT